MMIKRGKSLLLSSAAALALTGAVGMGTAWAGAADDCCDDVEDLQRQIYLLQGQIDDLKAALAKKPESDLKVKWKAAPEFSEGGQKFKVRGRIMADYVYQDGDAIDGIDPEPFVNGTEFRRLRLGVEGQWRKSTKYKFEADFADNEVSVTDAYLEQKLGGPGNASVVIGQFKTYNSLEEQTSSRYTTFMERAAFTDAFGLARQIGIGAQFKGENWTFNVGGFGESNDPNAPDNNVYEESWTVAARGTYGFDLGEVGGGDSILHVGGSVRWTSLGDDTSVRLRQRPQLHLSERFIDTNDAGGLDADSTLFWGIEAAGVFGPFSIQGEYAQQNVDRNGPVDDYTATGWYVGASWFITGESRAYKADKGSFGRVQVNNSVNDGGFGAWQLAVRYDTLDLNDEDLTVAGEQSAIIAGVNWHLNNYTRLMFNYVYADIEDSDQAADLTGLFDTELNQVGFRAQIDW